MTPTIRHCIDATAFGQEVGHGLTAAAPRARLFAPGGPAEPSPAPPVPS